MATFPNTIALPKLHPGLSRRSLMREMAVAGMPATPVAVNAAEATARPTVPQLSEPNSNQRIHPIERATKFISRRKLIASTAASAVSAIPLTAMAARSSQERLTDALERGLIFGLDRAGKLSISDPKQGLDGVDQTWWGTQNWTDVERKRFSEFLRHKLEAAADQVLVGEPTIFDRLENIGPLPKAQGTNRHRKTLFDLTNAERANWYRKNLFDLPIKEVWPQEGIEIRDAVLLGQPLELEITDQIMEDLVGKFWGHLLSGMFVASGVIGRNGRKRIPIPAEEFETLHLGAWQYDIIKDEIDRVYSKVRIHNPDNLPANFSSQYKKQKEAFALSSDPVFSKDGWGYTDWIRNTIPDKNVFPEGIEGLPATFIGAKVYKCYRKWLTNRNPGSGELSSKHPLDEEGFRKRADDFKKGKVC